jgi:hypothetical protein
VGENLSEDAYRERWHAKIIAALGACRCAGANVDAVENLLLSETGAFTVPMRRLPLELSADTGELVSAAPEANATELLDRLAANMAATAPARRTRLRASPTAKAPRP